ncbi:MAG: hypothetical protein NZ807_01950 [Dehalococcoidia bacterium]|jgi:hypothetical protein|nr:hypothetical protein [Dehalococcoidia bacterium]|tara:strand:- start:105 stop:422 length:318 start_codon:yes stop_codon:yes gene_type:complete
MGFLDRFFGKKEEASPPPVATSGNDEDMIRANIQQIGLNSFPDNEQTVWNIVSIEHKDGSHWVETAPVPDVGFPRVMFVLDSPDIRGVKAAYYFDNDDWSLIFSS